jgi:hypothetical protein
MITAMTYAIKGNLAFPALLDMVERYPTFSECFFVGIDRLSRDTSNHRLADDRSPMGFVTLGSHNRCERPKPITKTDPVLPPSNVSQSIASIKKPRTRLDHRHLSLSEDCAQTDRH